MLVLYYFCSIIESVEKGEKRMERILLVEDNEHIMRINTRLLSGLGYEILAADCAERAIRLLEREQVDLIVLDIMLPDGDGVELCTQIRKTRGTPILFLTAKTSSADIVTGLRRGADDYLTKPYDLNVLAARIEALLRRSREALPETGAYEVGPLRFVLMQSRASVNGQDLNLSGKEYGTLLYLCRHRGVPVSRDELYHAVWGENASEAGRSIVWTTVSRLKKKLQPYDSQISLDSSHDGYELFISGGTT